MKMLYNTHSRIAFATPSSRLDDVVTQSAESFTYCCAFPIATPTPQLVRRTLTDNITEKQIELLAYKVAKERVEAKINIGDFIHNVNQGRTIVFESRFL